MDDMQDWVNRTAGIGAALLSLFTGMGAVAALAVGWIVALRRRTITCPTDGVCARPARSWLTFGMLGLSTLLVGVAAAWGWIEPPGMAALSRFAEDAA
jgi:hypothetical protein